MVIISPSVVAAVVSVLIVEGDFVLVTQHPEQSREHTVFLSQPFLPPVVSMLYQN